jgi:hypothetical protein
MSQYVKIKVFVADVSRKADCIHCAILTDKVMLNRKGFCILKSKDPRITCRAHLLGL